jgi:hypothetical protein
MSYDYPQPCSRNNPHTPHGYCPGTAPEFPWEKIEHTHSHQGQSLRHSHPGGDEPHGYYGHPEDIPPPGVERSRHGLFGPDDRIWQQYPA